MPLLVLYDGWPLVYQPNSAAALHLYSLLSLLPDQVQAALALPGPDPEWLPTGLSTEIIITPDTPPARLGWEQRTLPALRQKLGASLLHHTRATPPLFGSAASALSPTEASGWQREAGFTGRLRLALSAGGMARLRAQFWPEDLPAPAGGAPLYRLPAIIDPASRGLATDALSGLELPESYVLYHGPTGGAELRRLLEAWSWAAGPLRGQVRLALVGVDEPARLRLDDLAQAYDLGDTVWALPPLEPGALPELYRHSLAFFSPAPEPPWGGPLRLALACARPVVAAVDPIAEAIVGPAAYLLQPDDLRGLGAALITVIIEEEVAVRLGSAGQQRASHWQRTTEFGEALLAAYRGALSPL